MSLFGLLQSQAMLEGAGVGNALVARGLNNADTFLAKSLGNYGQTVSGILPNSWLGQSMARNDPLLSFDWSINLPTISGIAGLDAHVEEASCSVWQRENTSVFRAGQHYYYPGAMDTTSLTLVLYEDNKANAQKYCYEWLSLVGDPNTGLVNYPAVYRKNISISMQDAAQNTIATLIYYGCWPGDMGDITLQSATSERVRVTLKLMVNGMSINFASGVPLNFGLGRIQSFISGVPQQIGGSILASAGSMLNNAVGGIL